MCSRKEISERCVVRVFVRRWGCNDGKSKIPVVQNG